MAGPVLMLLICASRGAILLNGTWPGDIEFRSGSADHNRIGRIGALVGQSHEFLRLVLIPHLLGNVPIEPRMCAQAVGEISRVGHDGRSG